MPDRKVDSLLGLAVLATLSERPMHRYEIAALIRDRGKDRDMAVKPGSLYTVVQNLAKHGFVETIGSERAGARPERTIYRITPAGVDELKDWTRDLVANVGTGQTPFVAGLSVVAALHPDDAVRQLNRRVDQLDGLVADRRRELDHHRAEVRRLFLVEDEYALTLLEAELAWVRGLLDELTSGRFPDLEAWRTFWSAAESAREGASTT